MKVGLIVMQIKTEGLSGKFLCFDKNLIPKEYEFCCLEWNWVQIRTGRLNIVLFRKGRGEWSF